MTQEEDKIAMLDEEIPDSWGEFKYEEVYQTEWSFNLSRTVLPGKVSEFSVIFKFFFLSFPEMVGS